MNTSQNYFLNLCLLSLAIFSCGTTKSMKKKSFLKKFPRGHLFHTQYTEGNLKKKVDEVVEKWNGAVDANDERGSHEGWLWNEKNLKKIKSIMPVVGTLGAATPSIVAEKNFSLKNILITSAVGFSAFLVTKYASRKIDDEIFKLHMPNLGRRDPLEKERLQASKEEISRLHDYLINSKLGNINIETFNIIMWEIDNVELERQTKLVSEQLDKLPHIFNPSLKEKGPGKKLCNCRLALEILAGHGKNKSKKCKLYSKTIKNRTSSSDFEEEEEEEEKEPQDYQDDDY